MDPHSLYVIDTSSLIGLQNWRPMGKHHAVWTRLDEFIESDQLISPIEVYEELRQGKDAVAKWAIRYKKRGQLFKKNSRQQS